MRTSLSHKAAVVLIGTAALSLTAGGTAYAYWTTTGTGTGSATSTTAGALVVSSTASVSGLYPTASNIAGGSINVTNPNPFNVTITRSFGATSTTTPGCTGSTVTLTVAAGAPTSIGPNATVAIPFTASMSNLAEDACQGANFTATLTVNGQSSS